VKLTLDCIVTSQHLDIPKFDTLAYLLTMGSKTWLPQPLEEYVCDEFGLKSQSDYPLAPIAASADGLDVGLDYWLRADLIHLVMQRDSFSLAEPVPFPMDVSQAQVLIASLNAHFQQQLNMQFIQGRSGFCYLKLPYHPKISTCVPSVAVGKNTFHFMPQGDSSAQWRAYLNEVQMLLHMHPVNVERESSALPAINSLWLSGGGVMPQKTHDAGDVSLIIAIHPFYRGLAQWKNLPFQNILTSMSDMLKNNMASKHIRIEYSLEWMSDGDFFQVLADALKTHQISQLDINLGYYDRTLTVRVVRLDLFKFWRKVKPLSEIFS
jgi:hypothetical protein